VMPKYLLEKFPDEMTIAIQYQYKNLVVEPEAFKISLSFGGKYEKLVVPYRAVTSFADPSMNFALKFSMSYSDIEKLEHEDFGDSNRANKISTHGKSGVTVDLSAKVISLEAFRKNKVTTHSDDNS